MTQDAGRIIVEVRVGRAEQADVGLTPGEPIDAFSVGRSGSWRIAADGIADVHAYMYFDGATLYLASVDQANPAWVNGRAVPADWLALTPPCEIALGGARLWAEVEEEFDVEPDEPEQQPAAVARAQMGPPPVDVRPKRPKISPPKLDEATASSALIARPPRPAQQGVRIEQKRDKVKQIKIRQSVREAPPDEESTRLAPIESAGAQEEPRAPLPAAGRPASADAGVDSFAPHAAGAPVPGGYPAPLSGAPVPGGYPQQAPFPGPASTPAGFVPPGVSAPVPGPFPPQGMGGAPVPGPFPPGPGAGSPLSAGPGPSAFETSRPQKKSVGATILDSWKQSSIPQKAILMLMPFAIASMFVIFDDKDEQEAAAPSGSRPVASARASGSPVASALPDKSAEPAATALATANPAGSGAAPETPPRTETNPALATAPARPSAPVRRPGKEPPKTPERIAADAVAAGNFAEAAKAYEALAAQRPDVPAFREAARILKEKAAAGGK